MRQSGRLVLVIDEVLKSNELNEVVTVVGQPIKLICLCFRLNILKHK